MSTLVCLYADDDGCALQIEVEHESDKTLLWLRDCDEHVTASIKLDEAHLAKLIAALQAPVLVTT